MRWMAWGDPDAPAAVVAHGAASTGEFVGRVFARPLANGGWRLVSWDSRGDLDAELAAAVAATGARLVGGVSMGAHAAVRYATRRRVDGLLLALPGWCGPADPASPHVAAAETVAAAGVQAALAQAAVGAPRWVVDELAKAWPTYGDVGLAEALRGAARSAGPTEAELAEVTAPAGVVALDGDPLHPLAVARAWARLMPRAALRVLPVLAPAGDRSVIGTAALDAYREAQRTSVISGPRSKGSSPL